MKAIELESLYIQGQVDDFTDYHLFVRANGVNVPLVVHEEDVTNKNLILWTEEELTKHLADQRCKRIIKDKIIAIEKEIEVGARKGLPTGGLYGELDTVYEILWELFPEEKPKED